MNGVGRGPSYSRRKQMLAHVSACQPPPAGTPPLLNPAYLSEMPAAARIEREVIGTDAVDATARRMGAFWQLREMIYTLALREGRSRTIATADEKRLADAYTADHNRLAAALQQSLSSTPEGARRYTELRRYADAPEIRDQLLARFFSPPFVRRYIDSRRPYAARLRAIVQSQMAQQVTPVGSGASEQAVARCLAAGRPALQCVGVGIGKRAQRVAGIHRSVAGEAVACRPAHGWCVSGAGRVFGEGLRPGCRTARLQWAGAVLRLHDRAPGKRGAGERSAARTATSRS